MEAYLSPFDRREAQTRREGALRHARPSRNQTIALKVDRKWRIAEISPGAAEYLHVRPDQALGHAIDVVGRPILGDGFAKRLRSACANHQMIRFVYISGTKRPIWLDVSCERVADGLLISLRDVTRRRGLEEDLRLIAATLLRQYDEERRTRSRALHDKIAQELVLALMEIEFVRGKMRAAERAAKLNEIWTVLRRALAEVKAMSNRMYPPMLDECGLVTSVKWLIREFRGRTGANVRLNASGTETRLASSVELALFSVVEEAFNLIERHGPNKRLEVDLAVVGRTATVRVKAFGRAFVSVLNALDEIAVSDSRILQLWARIRQLDGTIEAKTAAQSATLSVTLPLRTSYRHRLTFSGTEIFQRALRRRQARRFHLAIPDGASATPRGQVSRPSR